MNIIDNKATLSDIGENISVYKNWMKYKQYLLDGEWHVHTNYTDGTNSVFELCQEFENLGIPLVAFTEHVRKELTYDFNQFLSDIEKAREEFDLIILSGCEVKVLPNGELDVEEWILRDVDYPIFAFHSFPKDIFLYVESLERVLKNKYVNSWAHPGAFLLRKGLELPEKDLIDIFKLMEKQDVLLEINGKYGVPSEKWMREAKKYNVGFVRGSDVHYIEYLEGKYNE